MERHRSDWQFIADVAEGPAATTFWTVQEMLLANGNLCFLDYSENEDSKLHRDSGIKLQIIKASHPVNFNPDHVRTVSKNEFRQDGVR